MNSDLGLVTLNPQQVTLGLGPKRKKPINRKLPIMKKASRRHIRGDLGSLGFTFIFLFFSFISRRFYFRADCFCSFNFFRFSFLESECYR